MAKCLYGAKDQKLCPSNSPGSLEHCTHSKGSEVPFELTVHLTEAKIQDSQFPSTLQKRNKPRTPKIFLLASLIF